MPKSVEVQVYSFAELSDKSKDRAHYDYLSSGFGYDGSDNIDTIIAFCDLFCIDLHAWSVDSYSYSYDATIPQQRSITKKQAVATVSQWADKVGYCLCYDAKQSLQDVANWRYGDLKNVLDECLFAMFKACRDDYHWQSSAECFAELCECNDWQFFADGSMFNE